MSTAFGHGVRIERSAKRVRARLGGQVVVDSVNTALVWEHPHYPTYYFPLADVAAQLTADGATHSRQRGDAVTYTVIAGSRRAPAAALRHRDSAIEELQGLVRLDWAAMDAWFEEDEEVFVHARDPYKRVDILPSSRHVRVEIGGVMLADSRSPRLLFETTLPVRYYLPQPHIRMDLLEHSATASECAYKGTAHYWSARIGDELHNDLAWGYRTPLPESQKIAGLVAFDNAKLDIFLDDALTERQGMPSD